MCQGIYHTNDRWSVAACFRFFSKQNMSMTWCHLKFLCAWLGGHGTSEWSIPKRCLLIFGGEQISIFAINSSLLLLRVTRRFSFKLKSISFFSSAIFRFSVRFLSFLLLYWQFCLVATKPSSGAPISSFSIFGIRFIFNVLDCFSVDQIHIFFTQKCSHKKCFSALFHSPNGFWLW